MTNETTGKKRTELNKQFDEQQRFHGWLLIALIVVLMLGIAYRIVEQAELQSVSGGLNLSSLILFEILLGAALAYLLALRVNIHADSRSIQVSKGPLAKERLEINWNDVAVCEIVQTPVLAQWSGANVNLEHEKRYSTCGRNGLHLVTRNGESVFIGSRKLDELRRFTQSVLKC